MGNLRLKGFVFAQVPIWLLACSDVDPQAKVVYAYLVWRQGQNEGCWPSVDRIARDLQVERKTVMRHLQRLEEMQYIEVHRESGRSNYYIINGEVPERITLSEQLAAELKISQPAKDSEPVPSKGLVADQSDGTSPMDGTTPVPRKGLDQSHPRDTNDIHERYPRTIEEGSAQKTWDNILDHLALSMGRNEVAMLRSVTRAERTDGRFVVKVSHDNWRDWLEGRAKRALQKMLTDEVGEVKLEFVKDKA